MTGRVADRVAVVTGGGHGLGAAICKRLAQDGARIAVADIDADAAASIASEIAATGAQAAAWSLDVTDEQAWIDVIPDIERKLGPVSIVVNNAGIAAPGTAEDTDFSLWRKIHAVNLDGVFLGTKHGILAMKSHGGAIVNISSVKAMAAMSLTAAYDSSKGAVRIFTKSAALHCAEQGYGIRVNSVHPGWVMTAMVEEGIGQLPDGEILVERLRQAHPIGRFGTPEEIANAVLFLASDEASFVTGAELLVDGGYAAQ